MKYLYDGPWPLPTFIGDRSKVMILGLHFWFLLWPRRAKKPAWHAGKIELSPFGRDRMVIDGNTYAFEIKVPGCSAGEVSIPARILLCAVSLGTCHVPFHEIKRVVGPLTPPSDTEVA